MSNAPAVSSGEFEEKVLQSTVPVLVDFWATWCGPCRTIAPHIDAIALDYTGRASVYKLNVDDEPDIAQKYGVMSIPTLVFFKGGKEVDQMVGAFPKNAIASKLEELI